MPWSKLQQVGRRQCHPPWLLYLSVTPASITVEVTLWTVRPDPCPSKAADRREGGGLFLTTQYAQGVQTRSQAWVRRLSLLLVPVVICDLSATGRAWGQWMEPCVQPLWKCDVNYEAQLLQEFGPQKLETAECQQLWRAGAERGQNQVRLCVQPLGLRGGLRPA